MSAARRVLTIEQAAQAMASFDEEGRSREWFAAEFMNGAAWATDEHLYSVSSDRNHVFVSTI